MTQRDFVRFIWPHCHNDTQRAHVIYDGIERGVIRRERTGTEPWDYAVWLVQDAWRRGWHSEPPSYRVSREDWGRITALLEENVWNPPSVLQRILAAKDEQWAVGWVGREQRLFRSSATRLSLPVGRFKGWP